MNVDYGFLIDYLKGAGYIVYPTELRCGWHEMPHYPYRWVDAAAYKGGKFYAFEYKSSSDPISGAVKQIENYRHSFNYVILLVEIPRRGRSGFSLTLNKGKRIYEIIRSGAGIWVISRNRVKRKDTIQEIMKPKRQYPHPLNIRYIEQKFQSYPWKDKMTRASLHPYQQKLHMWQPNLN